jgi:predicted MFS family arabinose efflux permease
VAALTGILTLFFDVAYQTYLPSLVEREHVLEGNSKLGMSSAGAEIAGPGVTGFLVQLITAPIAILLDSISFLISAALISSIRRAEAVMEKLGEVSASEAMAGLKILWQRPVLRALAGRAVLANFFGVFLGPLYVLYAIRTLGLGPALLGIIIATGGAGYMLGSIYAGRAMQRFGAGPVFIGSGVATGLALLLIPLAHGSPATAASFLVAQQLLGDSCAAIYMINEVSLRQSIVEDCYLGRVNAAMQMMVRGMWPLGALAGGALGGWIGLRATMAVAGAGLLLSCLWLVFSPVRRLRSYGSA